MLASALTFALFFLVLDHSPVGTETWFENFLDRLSVQSVLFHGRGVRWGELLGAHLRFYDNVSYRQHNPFA